MATSGKGSLALAKNVRHRLDFVTLLRTGITNSNNLSSNSNPNLIYEKPSLGCGTRSMCRIDWFETPPTPFRSVNFQIVE